MFSKRPGEHIVGASLSFCLGHFGGLLEWEVPPARQHYVFSPHPHNTMHTRSTSWTCNPCTHTGPHDWFNALLLLS